MRCARRCTGTGSTAGAWASSGSATALVLAHELAAAGRGSAAAQQRAPPWGTRDAPTDTIADAASHEGDRLVANLLATNPRPSAGPSDGLRRRPASTFPGARPSRRRWRSPSGPCPGARSSPTASSRLSPAARARLRAAGTFCAQNRFSLLVPCHRVVARRRDRRLRRRGPRAQAAAARPRGMTDPALSRTSEPSWQRSRRGAAATGSRSCPRCSTPPAAIHLLGRGRVALQLDLGSPAAARRAFALLRELGIHSQIRTYRQHAFERPTRYQLHVDGDASSLAVLAEAGVDRPLPPAVAASAAARRRPYVLPLRLPSRQLARRRIAVRAAFAAPRAAHPVCATVRRSSRRSRRARGSGSVSDSGRATQPPMPRAGRRSARSLPRPVPPMLCSPSRSAPSSQQRALRRTGLRTPTMPTSCARVAPRRNSSKLRDAFARRADWTGCRAGSARQQSCVSVIRRSRWPSWPVEPTRAATKAGMQRRLARVVELASR